MRNTVLNNIYSYSLQSATTIKKLAPVTLQVHLPNHFDWAYLNSSFLPRDCN